MSNYSVERLDNLVGTIQQYTTVRWYTTRRLDEIKEAVEMLHIVHEANLIKEAAERPALDYEMFYNDAVNTVALVHAHLLVFTCSWLFVFTCLCLFLLICS
jgi:hypothetical protein